jgi:hypothetical protein
MDGCGGWGPGGQLKPDHELITVAPQGYRLDVCRLPVAGLVPQVAVSAGDGERVVDGVVLGGPVIDGAVVGADCAASSPSAQPTSSRTVSTASSSIRGWCIVAPLITAWDRKDGPCACERAAVKNSKRSHQRPGQPMYDPSAESSSEENARLRHRSQGGDGPATEPIPPASGGWRQEPPGGWAHRHQGSRKGHAAVVASGLGARRDRVRTWHGLGGRLHRTT